MMINNLLECVVETIGSSPPQMLCSMSRVDIAPDAVEETMHVNRFTTMRNVSVACRDICMIRLC